MNEVSEKTVPYGGHLKLVRETLLAAGEPLPAGELIARTGIKAQVLHSVVYLAVKRGKLVAKGLRSHKLYGLAPADPLLRPNVPRACLPAPYDEAGVIMPRVVPPKLALKPTQPVVVPDDVKRTYGAAHPVDERYQVDPATFRGGSFMAEWHYLRTRRATKPRKQGAAA